MKEGLQHTESLSTCLSCVKGFLQTTGTKVVVKK
jgi:hypothetical protein